MKVLIYGGASSGKSEYAENLAVSIRTDRLIYLATMNSSGDEAKKRINKHRKKRQGKEFVTIECPYDLDKLDVEAESTILLECMSNLVANEMFRDGKIIDKEEVIKKVLNELRIISDKAENIVIVSNDIFSSGESYDEISLEYMKALAMINKELVKEVDQFYEVIVGIPKRRK